VEVLLTFFAECGVMTKIILENGIFFMKGRTMLLLGGLLAWPILSIVSASTYSDIIGSEYANDPFFANNTTSILDNDYLATNQIGTGVASPLDSSNLSTNTIG